MDGTKNPSCLQRKIFKKNLPENLIAFSPMHNFLTNLVYPLANWEENTMVVSSIKNVGNLGQFFQKLEKLGKFCLCDKVTSKCIQAVKHYTDAIDKQMYTRSETLY